MPDPAGAPARGSQGTSPATIVLRALGLCALLAALGNVSLAFHDAWAIKEKVDQVEQDLARARDRNERTRRQIQSLQTSPRTVEQVQRLHSQLKPGEEIVPTR